MLKLTDSQKVALSIAPTDAAGNAALVEGVEWKSSDESLLTVTASEDGLSAVASTVGPLGSAQVQVSADALIGDGGETLTGVLDVEIVGGKAVSLGIAAGTPEEK